MHGSKRRELETEQPGHGHRSEAARRGNPGKSGCGTSRRTTPPRQLPTLQRNSCDVTVFEMGEDKGGPGDVADLAGAKLPDPAAPGPQGRGWSGSTRRSTLTRPARPC